MGSPMAHPCKALNLSLLPMEESTECQGSTEPFPRASSPISRVFLSLLKSQLNSCRIFFLFSISSSCSLNLDCILISANSNNFHLSHLFQPHLPHLSSWGFPDFPIRWAFLLSFLFSLSPCILITLFLFQGTSIISTLYTIGSWYWWQYI